MPQNLRLAIGSILVACMALSFGDALIKAFSLQFSLWQLFVLRSVFATLLLLPLIRLRNAGLSLVPVNIGWTALRSVLLVVMWITYYTALPHIKLSVAAAMYYTSPLFITLFAAGFTGDPVSRRSWFAVLLGFSGVLVIIRPDADGFNGYVLLPLLAAILYAVAMILTRSRCSNENPMILALSLNIAFIVAGCVASLLMIGQPAEANNAFLLGPWTQLDPAGYLVLAMLAVCIVVGGPFTAIAYQKGPSPVVAAFDYSYLAFSALWGLLLFSELPDLITLTGVIMIAAGGVLAVRS